MDSRTSSGATNTGTSPPSSLPAQPAAEAMTGRISSRWRGTMRKERGACPAATARVMTLEDSAMYRPRRVSSRRRSATSVSLV